MRRVSHVKVLRQRLGMTQAEFAAAFHLPVSTLRDWDQHQSNPDAPARALLLAIERDPGCGNCWPNPRPSEPLDCRQPVDWL
jgi:putative transcriptional regulator